MRINNKNAEKEKIQGDELSPYKVRDQTRLIIFVCWHICIDTPFDAVQ
jgi:hypothetical protein